MPKDILKLLQRLDTLSVYKCFLEINPREAELIRRALMLLKEKYVNSEAKKVL